MALLLTGMGTDGAEGMVALREVGAMTIAEDERSCVVFGMPAAAIDRGGATHVASRTAMPRLIAEGLMPVVHPPPRPIQTGDRVRPIFRLHP